MNISNYFSSVIPNIDENEYLREPQKIAYSKVFDHFITKKKMVDAIVILPTGVGKTGLMGILPYGIAEGKVLIITPQIVIKDNVVGSLDPEYPDNFWLTQKVFNKMEELPCLIEYEGRDTKDEWLEMADIIVVNAQKLQSRLASSLINRVSPDFFDMIIIDEAHHSTALTWVETLKYFSEAKVVKLTGTPFRSDGKKIVGEIAYEYKLSAAMAHQYVKSLQNFTYIPEKIYLTVGNDNSKQYTVEEILDLGIKDEDWISRTVAYSVECSSKIVQESIKKLEAKLTAGNTIPHKIIAVACSIPHAKQIKTLYEEHGYQAAIIHSDMDKKEKVKALSDIENHRVKVIINVAMLGEGYDHPYLSIAAIFRPFKSLLPYAQFIGRVLRAIPKEDEPKSSDNIAEIICHRDYYLHELWEYYKQEIKESETIKYLATLNLDEQAVTDEEDNETKTQNRKINKDIGQARELGAGTLTEDTYLNTKLIEKRKQEEEEELRKIRGLQELLSVTAEEARNYLHQSQKPSLSLKRPDLYFKRKRKGIDARIKEDIVPSLLNKYNLDKSSDALKSCRIFRLRSWIARKSGNNAGMLAIYITDELNKMIGQKRDSWQATDWDRAEKKLDHIEEFLDKVLEEFVASN